MDFNENTRLRDILAAYPWLPDTLVQMDSRFKIIQNPIGKLLIRTASLGDACKKAGYPLDLVVQELKKLITAHEGRAE